MTTFNKTLAANGQVRLVPFSIRKMAAAGALMAGMAFAPAALADMYFGVNAGKMMIDLDGFDDPTNAGVLIGKEWGVVAGDLGVEAEFTTSIDDGSFLGNDVNVNTQAVYGAFRTAGPVYLIAKAGLLREEVEVGSGSDSDTGMSAGIGVGFSLGLAQMELQYTVIEEDISYLSVGVRF
jgi:outer membrane immunogenic protein